MPLLGFSFLLIGRGRRVALTHVPVNVRARILGLK
jgi:hypothetical protein